MGKHRVVLAQDKGNVMVRAFHFVKTESFHWLRVVVKNLYTQEMFDYDTYHEEFDNGKYVLLFIDEDGTRKGTMELEINDNSPATIYIVYKWSEFVAVFSTDKVSEHQFKEMANSKRLMNPKGYRGY